MARVDVTIHTGGDFRWIRAHDWSAGILACMSAKHEQTVNGSGRFRFDAAKTAALQARMPAFQSRPYLNCPGIGMSPGVPH